MRKPSYVPEGSVYVGRDRRRKERRQFAVLVALLVAVTAVLLTAAMVWTDTASRHGRITVRQAPVATPTTYGPPHG